MDGQTPEYFVPGILDATFVPTAGNYTVTFEKEPQSGSSIAISNYSGPVTVYSDPNSQYLCSYTDSYAAGDKISVPQDGTYYIKDSAGNMTTADVSGDSTVDLKNTDSADAGIQTLAVYPPGPSSGTLTVNNIIYSNETYGGWYIEENYFNVALNNGYGTQQVFCIESHHPSSPVGTRYNNITVSNNMNLRKAMYYGQNGPLIEANAYMTGQSFNTRTALTAVIGSMAYAGTCGKDAAPSYKQTIENIYRNWMNNLPAPPDNYIVYVIHGGADQDLAFGKVEKPIEEPGRFRIKKTGTDTLGGGVDGNNSYSMVGATFDVYKQSNMEKVDTLTVGSDLYTNYTKDLDPGNYVVYETGYGSGYIPEKDSSGKPVGTVVTVTSGNTTMEITKNNIPVYAPFGLKLAGKTDQASSAPLEGAVFRVEYFKNGVSDASPDKTWYLRSDSKGEITVGQATETWNGNSSDTWYTSNGQAVLPLGWLRITEVEAPNGYFLPDSPSAVVQIKNGNATSGDKDSTIGDATNVIYQAPSFSDEQIIKGKFRIKKESAYDLTGGTDNNNCYSMIGATFDVYNADKTEKVATLTVGDDLYTEYTPELNPGTYVVEETSYGTGYVPELSEDWKPVSFTVDIDGRTAETTVTRKNNAVYAPPDVKLAAKTSSSDNAPLAGALFEVKFFAADSADPAAPTRTWYLRSDAQGEIKIGQATESWDGKESDPWYIDPYNNPCIPLGTLQITELEAPAGYMIADNATATVQIKNPNPSSGNQDTTLNWGLVTLDAPTFANTPVMVDLIKTDSDSKQPLSGAVFELTKPDGSTEEGTTGQDGKLSFGPLTPGDYKLQEVKAPEGYISNNAVITFTVNANTGITNWQGLDQAGAGMIENELNMPNSPKAVPFKIVKTNDLNQTLEGAIFGIYTDEACTTSIAGAQSYPTANGDVMGFRTDANGVLEATLDANTQYYIKELAAPEGYSLALDTEGNVHVYALKFNSNPAENKFSVTLDGKDYTETVDPVTISKDGDSWTVNLNIVNERGHQLPDTGGNEWMFFAFMIVLVGAGAILLKQKRFTRS